MVERFGRTFTDPFTGCPKCSEPSLVEVLLGKPGQDGKLNAIAHCHFCGHQQTGVVEMTGVGRSTESPPEERKP